MKKQTAVEWLFAHLIPHLDWSYLADRNKFRQLQQEAIAMEKEQIIEANEDCSTNELGELFTGEQYYNETYG
jgi:hypothetical protein